jgi:hypothetical protein
VQRDFTPPNVTKRLVLPSSTVGNPTVTHLGGIVLRLNSTPSELPSIGYANDEESQTIPRRRAANS